MSERTNIPVQQINQAFNIPVVHEDYRFKESEKAREISTFEANLFRTHRAKFGASLMVSTLPPDLIFEILEMYDDTRA